MANRFVNPLPFFDDDTGAPYEGAQLFFYVSGTDTKLDTYSNAGLSIANTNPIILDSAGRVPNAVFLQTLQYKVVLAPADDTDPPTSPIWTQDPVYTSDYSTTAKFHSGSGSPNGSVAGTAGSSTTSADAYWDYTNDIIYICTTTGSSSTAVWTAINATTAAAVVPAPQGYLTLTSGTPVITGDVAAATAVYYTPYTGLLVPIYSGTAFIPTSIVTELSLTLSSSHIASNIYDFYIFSLNGVATLGTGPSWSAGTSGSITAGSCARGTGTGGAALSRLSGIYTNAVSMTIRYGDGTTTTTVDANKATYVGSMFMDGTNGQVSCYRSYGQSRKWGIWNYYNRQSVTLQMGDATASWNYNNVTIRESNGSTNNTAATFMGVAEEPADILFVQTITLTNNGAAANVGIGINSTTTITGKYGAATTTATGLTLDLTAHHVLAPTLGINNITSNENSTATVTSTFLGGNAHMLMTLNWRA